MGPDILAQSSKDVGSPIQMFVVTSFLSGYRRKKQQEKAERSTLWAATFYEANTFSDVGLK